MDPLSDVFALLRIEALLSSRFEAGGSWAVRLPAQPYIKFGAALRGNYWMHVEGEAPRRIGEGDTYLKINCPEYVIASDLAIEPIDGLPLFRATPDRSVHLHGDDTVILGGAFVLDPHNANLLLDVLPSVIHIPASHPSSPILRHTLQLLDDELRHNGMGHSVMANRLGDILLVQALRAYVDHDIPIGWLGAIGHPRIGQALQRMHAEASRAWKVDELASLAGMSRSDFARKFKECVGLPPLDYLIRWRMHLARHALRDGNASVASIAASLGYASESAFGNAFKRVFGRAPKRYWTRETQAPP